MRRSHNSGLVPAKFRPFAGFLSLLLATTGLAGAELAPILSGPFAVATTNLEARPQADTKAMFDFLNGKASADSAKYLTDILVHPAAVPTLHVDVPSHRELFGAHAGRRLPVVLLVVYPTTADNPRADYHFPYQETGDAVFSRMQQPGDKPLLADSTAKYPLIVFSGGYNTHGLWHLSHLKALAAQGYIVVDMFHGDGRGPGFAGNAALRSLTLRATLDFMLQHQDFAPAIDPERIGAVGESAGGHTVLTALGGIDPAGKMPAGEDARIKAAIGVVPFMGGSMGFWPFKLDLWFFGSDHTGLKPVTRPFMALYAEDDSNVPPEGVEAGLRAMSGPATGVMLDDEKHLVSDPANSDIRTWEILFFDAWLRADPTARRKLATGTSVRGGVTDHRTISQPGAGPR